ncbi:MAG: glycosyltransferase [Actinobacteria bacterium]|nr:glycosyltransferase [Actinomycetota bacterium]MBW3649872.1 glycosyltransferase [Actinomycetota bacterium]
MTWPATYVLPLRWRQEEPLDEPTAYLRWLTARMEVVVVDGSPPALFEHHHRAWRDLVSHVRPDARFTFTSGKVNGVLTGLHLAAHDHVVVADDDVRYDEEALRRTVDLLDQYDVVLPQNYFDPLVWHARWDTARTLLNRGVAHDWPGTLGVRRSRLLRAGGYDGDVLFENLELVRTVVAAGGSHTAPLDLFVRRLPPTTAQFWSQRTRQAYDEFARPPLLVGALAVLPALTALLVRRRGDMILAGAGAAVTLAEVGRRRGSGAAVFPASASLMAPCWLLERAICSWIALGQRLLFGGVRYGDVILRRAATRPQELRSRVRSYASSRA